MFGGLVYECGGFVFPLITFGLLQVLLALISALTLTELDMKEDFEHDKKMEKFPFSRFSVFLQFGLVFLHSSLPPRCGGMLSINLEPQVLPRPSTSLLFILVFSMASGMGPIVLPVLFGVGSVTGTRPQSSLFL
jgi:hypothetical protein